MKKHFNSKKRATTQKAAKMLVTVICNGSDNSPDRPKAAEALRRILPTLNATDKLDALYAWADSRAALQFLSDEVDSILASQGIAIKDPNVRYERALEFALQNKIEAANVEERSATVYRPFRNPDPLREKADRLGSLLRFPAEGIYRDNLGLSQKALQAKAAVLEELVNLSRKLSIDKAGNDEYAKNLEQFIACEILLGDWRAAEPKLIQLEEHLLKVGNEQKDISPSSTYSLAACIAAQAGDVQKCIAQLKKAYAAPGDSFGYEATLLHAFQELYKTNPQAAKEALDEMASGKWTAADQTE